MKATRKPKPGATKFAQGIVYFVGFAALAVCFILLPELARENSIEHPATAYTNIPILLAAYTLATPFFIALYHTLKLLRYIEQNQAFTHQFVEALGTIKRCAITFAVLMICITVAGVNWLHAIDPTEDMPPFLAFGSILTFAASVIAVFVAVLQKLMREAIAMKSENDLTV